VAAPLDLAGGADAGAVEAYSSTPNSIRGA
jgi:hypothetical protein